MLRQYEELAVLEQGDDGAIVSIRGQEGPAVVLGASYLGHLEGVLARAESDLEGASGSVALKLLCLEVRTLLETYNDTCNKYYGEVSPAKSLAAVTAELELLRKQLSQL